MSEKTIYKNLPIVSAKCTGLDDLGQRYNELYWRL